MIIVNAKIYVYAFTYSVFSYVINLSKYLKIMNIQIKYKNSYDAY